MSLKILFLTFVLVSTISAFSQSKNELIDRLKKTKSLAEKGRINNDIGSIYFGEGDFKNALPYFFQFLKFAEKAGDKKLQGAACNNIACVFNETENYDKAIEYAQKGLSIYTNEKSNYSGIADLYNTLGISHYYKSEDEKAYNYYKKSIYYDSLLNDKLSYAIKYRNLGANCIEMKMYDEGFDALKKSLAIYSEFKDTAHLFTIYVALSESYTLNNQLDSTRVYLEKAKTLIPFLPSNKSKLDDYYYSEYSYHEKKGEFNEALLNYKKYTSLKDSIVNIESNQAMHDVQVKYETAKKDLQLKKQQLVISENRRNLIILMSLILAVLLIGGIVFYFIRSRHKLQLRVLESEKNNVVLEKLIEGEEKERSRIAKELHDGVVQELTAVYLSLNQKSEIVNPIENQEIQQRVKQISSDVRNLSHAMMPISIEEKGLTKAIDELFQRSLSLASIHYSFESFNLENRLSPKIELNLYRIIQELINNVLKHSQATEVNCLLRKKEQELVLMFEDNGVGFDFKQESNRNGLQNLRSRLNFLHGNLELKSTENGNGVYFLIKVPLES